VHRLNMSDAKFNEFVSNGFTEYNSISDELIWNYTDTGSDRINLADGSVTLRAGYYIMGFDSMGSSRFGYIQVKQAPPSVALPSPQNFAVNGVSKDPDRYLINNNNYFKLRDLAVLLNGTSAQFDVGYDNGYVTITTGKAYTPLSTDMAPKGTANKTATLSADQVMLNGQPVDIIAYKIDGSNYFQLRDLGDKIGFSVDYDGATGTVIVKTN